jgi:hypothetical protein
MPMIQRLLTPALLWLCAVADCPLKAEIKNNLPYNASEWITPFLLRETLLDRIAAIPAEASVQQYGADPTGAADSTAAFQACLNAVGSGNTCSAAGGKFKILGNLAIPANTTLSCGQSFPDADPSSLDNLPAIMLDSAHTISAGGWSAWIKNCLIYRNGMTFPAPNSSAFAGVALADAGNANFTVTDCIIVGFDTAIYFTAGRPYVRRVHADGAGVDHAVVEVDTGNSDSGYIRELKIQPVATLNGDCIASVRPGTGLRMGGVGGPGAYITDIVSQNFQTAQFDFQTSTLAGRLWADNINGAASCGPSGFGTSIGVKIAPGVQLTADQVEINQCQTGLLTQSNGTESHFGSLIVNFSGQDAIVLGDGIYTGNITANLLEASNNGRYAINIGNVNSSLSVLHGGFVLNHGSAAPYFSTSVVTLLRNNPPSFWILSLTTDLPAGVNPFLAGSSAGTRSGTAGFYAGSGSQVMLEGMRASLSGFTGLGANGTAMLFGGSDTLQGYINLKPAGTAPGTSGNVILGRALPAANFIACTSILVNGTSAWPANSFLTAASIDAERVQFQWTAGSALTNGQTYVIAYSCHPF